MSSGYRMQVRRFWNPYFAAPLSVGLGGLTHGVPGIPRALSGTQLPGAISDCSRSHDGPPITLDEIGVIKPLQRRFLEGFSWDSCGYVDTAISKSAVWKTMTGSERHLRLKEIEELFSAIARDGVRRRRDVSKSSFREWGGVMIHLDIDGVPIFGDGQHRLEAALAADIKYIPAMCGVIEQSALSLESLRELTQAPH